MAAPDSIAELIVKADTDGKAELARWLRRWLLDVLSGDTRKRRDARRDATTEAKP